MDRGVIFTKRIDIIPGNNGSFIVRAGAHDYDHGRMPDYAVGFTNIDDLMAWLEDNAEAVRNQKSCGAEAPEQKIDHMAAVKSSVQR